MGDRQEVEGIQQQALMPHASRLSPSRAIGIDLGTTYTVVATIDAGRPRVLLNAEGQPLTPSVVAFTPDGNALVGQSAKDQAAANPGGTASSIKRRMGSGHRVKLLRQEYSPPQISSQILRKVKADAEDRLGQRIERVVITVPAYFNDRQRQATREAGGLAGLEVMRIINEPTAAAMAYGLEREEVHTILVWDVGGGTFDVSILELGERIFEVRAVAGDSWLGGDDVDRRVMDYLAAQYSAATGAEFPADAGLRQRLREAAEEAKEQLSFFAVTRVRIPQPNASEGYLEVDLTRGQLESLIPDLLERMARCTRQALSDAGLTPQEIDRVVLVGGATRMPVVRALARHLLGKEPYRSIDPDLVVAMGAGIQAGMLLGQVEKAVLLDVLPLSLGVETQGALMSRIIPRNTPLPASGAHVFTTAVDYQTSMDIHVLQGERALAGDNVSLGRFQLDGLPPALRGVAKVEVAFEADVDGIIHASAIDLLNERQVNVQVTSSKLFDPSEIDHLVEEADRSRAQDRHERERIGAGTEAEHLIAAAEMALEEIARPPSDPDVQAIVGSRGRIEEALAGGNVEEIGRHCSELRRLLDAIHQERARTGARKT